MIPESPCKASWTLFESLHSHSCKTQLTGSAARGGGVGKEGMGSSEELCVAAGAEDGIKPSRQ